MKTRKNHLFAVWVALMCVVSLNGQTDYTSYITNPSFEQGTGGWEHKGMGGQTNNVFTLKDGNTYMERWTGRGGAVGDAHLAQQITNLPPGNYEMTAAAQNIQEDRPKEAQTGAWIFAENVPISILHSSIQKTTVNVRDNYKVAFNVVSGGVTIGFEAKEASGNWIAVDNFRLTRVGGDLSAELAFYEKTFNFYQVLVNMPSGNYQLHASAFQRPGSYSAVYAPYSNGKARVTSSLYINSTAEAVRHICDDRQPEALYTGSGADRKLADGTYIPDCMTGAETYFAKGLYESAVSAKLDEKGSSLRIGIKCTSAPSYYWTMFDHFRLYFYGQGNPYTAIDDDMYQNDQEKMINDRHSGIYDVQGRKVNAQCTMHHTPLPKGVYIINRKKHIIK